jgi:uncharacterized protein
MTAAATLTVGAFELQILPDRAVYLAALDALLVSDLHLGKAETFQHYGIAVPSQINQGTLDRLERVCTQYRPRQLWILGDLVHGRAGLVAEVVDAWRQFLQRTQVEVALVAGNHDRPLQTTLDQLAVECRREAVALEGLILSHEPTGQGDCLNLCGHIHPCWRLRAGGDRLRLPCFHWQPQHQQFTLPAFGEFTGGYDITLGGGEVAYVVADQAVVPFGPKPLKL